MKLTKEYFENWLEGFRNAWFEKDIKKAVSHFSKVNKYWESPFIEPTNDINKITDFWDEVKNQEIEKLDFNIIAIENNIGITNWNLVFKDINGEEVEFDGVYVIYFDDDLNCAEFRQWSKKR